MATEMLQAGISLPIVARRLDHQRAWLACFSIICALVARRASVGFGDLPDRRAGDHVRAALIKIPLDLQVDTKAYRGLQMTTGLKIKEVADASGFTATIHPASVRSNSSPTFQTA